LFTNVPAQNSGCLFALFATTLIIIIIITTIIIMWFSERATQAH
jgi:hypothetical protein